MQDIDLEDLPLDELKDLEKRIAEALASYRDRRKDEAYAAVVATAKAYGFSIEELATGVPRKTRTVNPPKYRHPDDPSVTWTGRGRQPNWIKEALANGGTLEDFLIEKTD